MNKADKYIYDDLKARYPNVVLAHSVIKVYGSYYGDEGYRGLTVAFRPALPNSRCKMLEVAVSYCSNWDTFKKKRGEIMVLTKFDESEIVKLPLADFYRVMGAQRTGALLLEMFTV